jgi:hypothetical protein
VAKMGTLICHPMHTVWGPADLWTLLHGQALYHLPKSACWSSSLCDARLTSLTSLALMLTPCLSCSPAAMPQFTSLCFLLCILSLMPSPLLRGPGASLQCPGFISTYGDLLTSPPDFPRSSLPGCFCLFPYVQWASCHLECDISHWVIRSFRAETLPSCGFIVIRLGGSDVQWIRIMSTKRFMFLTRSLPA